MGATQPISGEIQPIQAAKIALSTKLSLRPSQILVKLMDLMASVVLLKFRDRFWRSMVRTAQGMDSLDMAKTES